MSILYLLPCIVVIAGVSNVICAQPVPRIVSHYFGIARVGDGGHLGFLWAQILVFLVINFLHTLIDRECGCRKVFQDQHACISAQSG